MLVWQELGVEWVGGCVACLLLAAKPVPVKTRSGCPTGCWLSGVVETGSLRRVMVGRMVRQAGWPTMVAAVVELVPRWVGSRGGRCWPLEQLVVRLELVRLLRGDVAALAGTRSGASS